MVPTHDLAGALRRSPAHCPSNRRPRRAGRRGTLLVGLGTPGRRFCSPPAAAAWASTGLGLNLGNLQRLDDDDAGSVAGRSPIRPNTNGAARTQALYASYAPSTVAGMFDALLNARDLRADSIDISLARTKCPGSHRQLVTRLLEDTSAERNSATTASRSVSR